MARFPRHASKTTRLHLEMDTWGEDVAIFTPKSMHGAKMLPAKGLIARIRQKGTHTARFLPDGPQVRRNARKGCEVLWGGMVGNAAEASNTAGSGVDGLGAADGSAGGLSATLAGATGAMEAGDGWPRGVGARSAQYASAGGGYSPKLASIAATRSSSAPMSCWFTSSIFCKSAGEAFST